MKKFVLFFAASVVAASTSAMAFHCPKDMKKIDEAIAANPSISTEQMETVKKLRAEGEVLHKEGKHQESVDVLAKAMAILGIAAQPN
ncbi:MAG: hypothetical protein WCD07_06755 [Burkholderiales bacterium]